MTTIIVPVYGAEAQTLACLDSLGTEIGGDTRLLVIDDASPDRAIVPKLRQAIERYGAHARLLVHERNLGFVATVNHGMAQTSDDVILLNSDTIASTGFVARLLECAATDPAIATITPFSNNAEICSFPDLCRAGEIPGNIDAIAAAAAALPNGAFIDLPTGVGFCLWINRKTIDSIGDFDVATFGIGYGEENDFGQRAIAHGWRNVLCHRAFVAHVGGTSFAATAHRPNGEALRRLLARYPQYNRAVAEFIAADPPCAWRRQLAQQMESRA